MSVTGLLSNHIIHSITTFYGENALPVKHMWPTICKSLKLMKGYSGTITLAVKHICPCMGAGHSQPPKQKSGFGPSQHTDCHRGLPKPKLKGQRARADQHLQMYRRTLGTCTKHVLNECSWNISSYLFTLCKKGQTPNQKESKTPSILK